LSSFPEIVDLVDDYVNNSKEEDNKSLFGMGVLYSHFRIIFNITNIFIYLHVYPGQYWDSVMEYKKHKFRFSGMFSKRYYLSDKTIGKDIGKISRNLPLRLNIAGSSLAGKFKNIKFNKFYKKLKNRSKVSSKKFKNYVFLKKNIGFYKKFSQLTSRS